MMHDCETCVTLQERFGTCQYMHDANSDRCTCKRILPVRSLNRQDILHTSSSERVRLAYWRHWAKTEGIRLGLMVVPEQPAPNLPKTDGKTGSSE